VQQIADGEVSPYLLAVGPGEEIELRGPIGGWFVWQPADEARILLLAGGSGIVPLMAMLRQRIVKGSAEFRLVYSVRSPADVYYAQELARLEHDRDWLQVAVVYTRAAPPQTARPPGRVRVDDLAVSGWTPDDDLRVYVCGPTGFVESVTTKLIGQGHRPSAIRTERFGPSG
jgi:ferredoxin-NADP reductase